MFAGANDGRLLKVVTDELLKVIPSAALMFSNGISVKIAFYIDVSLQ